MHRGHEKSKQADLNYWILIRECKQQQEINYHQMAASYRVLNKENHDDNGNKQNQLIVVNSVLITECLHVYKYNAF